MDPLLLNAAAIAALMIVVWLFSVALRDASIVDPIWGAGFVLVAWLSFATANSDHRSLLPVLLTSIWGVRLSAYLAWRNHGKPEDYRYQAMREKHGAKFPVVSLFTVFALQGIIMWIVSLPLQTAHSAQPDNLMLMAIGTLLFAVGLFFEAVGDWQLAHFKKNPDNKGQVMQQGLWRYTRHPNYFGDFCVWWGLYLLCIGCGAPYWTAVGPVLMSICLMKISGVTLLEQSLTESKPGYVTYVRRTNAFFPWRPRQAS